MIYHVSLCLLLLVKPLTSFLLTSPSSIRDVGRLRKYNTVLQADATRVGFVGCGTIAVAIARGLVTQSHIPIDSIAVSRRSEAKSKILADSFPELVTVHDDNQSILDNADLIFLCVLPQQTSEVLKSLSFSPSRHTLVSLAVSYQFEFIR